MKLIQARPKIIIGVFFALAAWLIFIFIALTWFQNTYVHSFTFNNPQFLKSSYTEKWFTSLLGQLPPKRSEARVIQLWQPDCLCNRFARPHALKAMELSKELGYEHLTLIPKGEKSTIQQLQTLNPNTQVLEIPPKILETWPSSPSVLIEGNNQQLMYIGPLGFGTFCNQATTSAIDSQLSGIANGVSRPFYNQIGQGCFCSWDSSK